MNRSMILKIAAAACVVALTVCGTLIAGQALGFGNRYADADKYTAGGTALDGAVKNLDIHWTDGSVNIAYHSQNTVEISETARKAISGDAALRWWPDGDTLRRQYAKSGFTSLMSLEKSLTVTLPEGVALESVAIDATSADVNAPDLRAETVRVDLTSGDLRAALQGAKDVSAHSSSGTIELDQTGAAERMALDSTSGDIRAAVSDVGSMRVTATSGDIRVRLGNLDELSVSTTSGSIAAEGGTVGKASLESTSGTIGVSLAAFDDLRIGAMSGDVTAALPTEPGYRADVDTTSGGFDYTVALRREGGAYSCGDASAHLQIDTTSGDVLLKDVNE